MDNGNQIAQPGHDGSIGERLIARPRRSAVHAWTLRAIGTASVALVLASAVSVALGYYGTDDHLVVGYSPIQPVEFSHKLHAGDLALDCRFCHSAAERGPMAGIPSTRLCMNCHAQVLPESVKLLPVRATYAENTPIAWIRVSRLPEYAYFDHSAHFAAGVGCSTCHGRVDLMLRTEQAFSLSMGFCLDCHRNPTPFIRDAADVTNMDWTPGQRLGGTAATIVSETARKLAPPLYCSGCHR